MALFRLHARPNLFNTGVRAMSGLDYQKADGTDWPISVVDYDQVNALNTACEGRAFISDGDLDERAREAGLAAIFAALRARNESTVGWDIIVNSSQPSGGEWNDASTKRWLHFTKVESGVEGIVASAYAGATSDGTAVVTWRVVSIFAELDA